MEKKFLLINTATYMREQCGRNEYHIIELTLDRMGKAGFDKDDIEEVSRLSVDDVWRDHDYEGCIVVRVM